MVLIGIDFGVLTLFPHGSRIHTIMVLLLVVLLVVGGTGVAVWSVYMVVVMVIGDGYGVILNLRHVSDMVIVIVTAMFYFNHNSSPPVFQ